MKLPARLVTIISIGIPCVLVFSAVWFVFFSRTFVIEYIDVDSDKIDPSLVRTLLFRYMDDNQGLLNQHNTIFFNKSSFQHFLSQYAMIDDFALTKHYPKSLRISLSGSPFHVLGYLQGHFYELSPQGTIVREIDPATLPQYPTVIGKALAGERISISKKSLKKMDVSFPVILLPDVEQVQMNMSVIDKDTLMHIENMKQLLRDEKYGILFFRIDPSGFEYRGFTNEGWNIIFSRLTKAPVQAENLKTLLLTTIKKKRKLLDYVDVRFENKLFYTLRN